MSYCFLVTIIIIIVVGLASAKSEQGTIAEDASEAYKPGCAFHKLVPGGPPGYHTPQELNKAFREVADDHSDIAMVVDLTTFYGTSLTWDGNAIYAIKLSEQVAAERDVPNRLIVSNHHARELITPELALNSTLEIVQGYKKGDKEIVELLENNQLWIMYTMNPDGLNYVWNVDNNWRKNRRPDGELVYGVDLNRNYPFGWDFSCAGSTVKTSQTYRGPSALSEPETQTMYAFQLDKRFAQVLDFHSYAREVRSNYGVCADLPSPIQSMLGDVSSEFAAEMRYEPARSCCTGGDISFAYHNIGSLATLVETGTSFQPPAEQMREELVRVWPGTKYYITLPISLSGHVLDGDSGTPIVSASLRILGLQWSYDETWSSSAPHGRYHLWTPPGSWTISVSAAGYFPNNFTVSVTPPTVHNFRLHKI